MVSAPKKEQLIYHPDTQLFEHEGKMFKAKDEKSKEINGVSHCVAIIYEEINPEEEREKYELIEEKLAEKLSSKRVVQEILKEMPTKQINKIYKLLSEGANVVRHDGCLGLQIDGGKRKKDYIRVFD